jgi:DNA-binding NarL/FixJ family response regulator
LSLLAEGKPYGRIADELNVSYKTVVNACSQLKQKLNAKNLPELIRVAVHLISAEPLGWRYTGEAPLDRFKLPCG